MVPWGENATVSVETLVQMVRTYEEAVAQERAYAEHPEEYEIILPIGVHPDLKEVNGIKVRHHIACPEGQALFLNKGYLQRQFDHMMQDLRVDLRQHWPNA